MVKIKNCGMKTSDAIEAAAKTGASFVGFIHHKPSPRHLEVPELKKLLERTPKNVAKVVVMVDPSDATLLSLPKIDFVQVYNINSPARIKDISQLIHKPIITAIRVKSKEDLALAHILEDVSAHILFDTHTQTEAGGSGKTFDWSLLAGLNLKKPWFLAGGLTSENVAEAIRITGAPMVDVASGIESAPGVKSLEKIAAFNAAVLGSPTQ